MMKKFCSKFRLQVATFFTWKIITMISRQLNNPIIAYCVQYGSTVSAPLFVEIMEQSQCVANIVWLEV